MRKLLYGPLFAALMSVPLAGCEMKTETTDPIESPSVTTGTIDDDSTSRDSDRDGMTTPAPSEGTTTPKSPTADNDTIENEDVTEVEPKG